MIHFHTSQQTLGFVALPFLLQSPKGHSSFYYGNWQSLTASPTPLTRGIMGGESNTILPKNLLLLSAWQKATNPHLLLQASMKAFHSKQGNQLPASILSESHDKKFYPDPPGQDTTVNPLVYHCTMRKLIPLKRLPQRCHLMQQLVFDQLKYPIHNFFH